MKVSLCISSFILSHGFHTFVQMIYKSTDKIKCRCFSTNVCWIFHLEYAIVISKPTILQWTHHWSLQMGSSLRLIYIIAWIFSKIQTLKLSFDFAFLFIYLIYQHLCNLPSRICLIHSFCSSPIVPVLVPLV